MIKVKMSGGKELGKAIAIFNQKGGVGKTTTNINLGASLAQFGKKVLMLDIDPQDLNPIEEAHGLQQIVYRVGQVFF